MIGTRRSRSVQSLLPAVAAGVVVMVAIGGGGKAEDDPAASQRTRASLPVADLTSVEFERHYDLPVGDKGEDRFDLTELPPACDRPGLAFDSAEVVYVHRRFGEAQVVSTPEPGCVRCGPIVVRRYHEPTGELHYRLRVHRRVVTTSCAVDAP